VPWANSIIGAKGMRLVTDSSSGVPQNGGFAAYEAAPFFSAADVVFRTRNTLNQTVWEALCNGQQQSFNAGEAHPRLRQNPTTGPGGYGSYMAGRGNVTPDVQWGRASGNGPAWQANCPIAPSSGVTGSRPNATNIPAGSMWFDTTIGKPIWSTGSAWVLADGTAA
jgi:hypothetical protein